MTEEERLDHINTEATKQLEIFLRQLDEKEITENQMLAISYASMIAVTVLGFSPEEMARDAAKAAEKIVVDIEDNI